MKCHQVSFCKLETQKFRSKAENFIARSFRSRTRFKNLIARQKNLLQKAKIPLQGAFAVVHGSKI